MKVIPEQTKLPLRSPATSFLPTVTQTIGFLLLPVIFPLAPKLADSSQTSLHLLIFPQQLSSSDSVDAVSAKSGCEDSFLVLPEAHFLSCPAATFQPKYILAMSFNVWSLAFPLHNRGVLWEITSFLWDGLKGYLQGQSSDQHWTLTITFWASCPLKESRKC